MGWEFFLDFRYYIFKELRKRVFGSLKNKININLKIENKVFFLKFK